MQGADERSATSIPPSFKATDFPTEHDDRRHLDKALAIGSREFYLHKRGVRSVERLQEIGL